MNKRIQRNETMRKAQPDRREVGEMVRWMATEEGQRFLSADMDESIRLLEERGEETFPPAQIPSERMLRRLRWRLRLRRMRVAMRIAAVAIPFLLLVGYVAYRQSRGAAVAESPSVRLCEVVTQAGEQQCVTLSDGSRVYLSARSRLRYPQAFAATERRIELEGEGYVEVEKAAHRPFVVRTEEASIQVLGTSFHVLAYAGEPFVVQLDKGNIRLSASGAGELQMHPGERVTYDKASRRFTSLPPESVSAREMWEKREFQFRNAPLADVLAALHRWFGVEFQVEEAQLLAYTYTFAAAKDSLPAILADMEKVSPVRFQRKGNQYKVCAE